MEEKIIIKIDEEGKLFAETEGFYGTSCVTEVDKLMKGISNSGHHKRKLEYYQEKIDLTNSQKVKHD